MHLYCRSWRLWLRHWIMSRSAFRPCSREEDKYQVLTSCHANGFLHKRIISFKRKGAYLFNTGAKKPSYAASPTQTVIAIFYAGWYTCTALVLWLSRSNAGWGSVILSRLSSVSLVASYEWTARGIRFPGSDCGLWRPFDDYTHY